MANPRLLGTNLETGTFTSSIGDNASYPSTNLNTYVKGDQWRSAGTTASQYIYLDVGTDTRLRTGIAIANHNLTGIMSTGVMQIQSATNNTFSSALVTLEVDFDPTSDPYYLKFGGVTTQRYWRILFAGTPSAAPRIGNLFIDEEFDFGFPYDVNYKPGNRQFQTSLSVGLDGLIRRSQIYAGRQIWEINFDKPGITDAVRSSFASFFNRVGGNLRPFYFIDTDDSIYYVHFDFSEDPTETRFYNLNSLRQIRMIAQEVG